MKTVVIDAGHGGIDGGAISGNHLEKDKNLKITLELGKLLESQGIKTIFTRTEDQYLTLNERTNIENNSNADCCVSLHMDSGPATASGMTIWLHSSAYDKTVEWAQNTMSQLKKVGFLSNRYQEINKGFRDNPQADYAWNRQTKSSSMLIELGFITNITNVTDFDNKYVDYAKAICKSICEFLDIDYKEPKPSVLYGVQVGAFANLDNAQKLVEELKEDGYQAIIKTI